MKRALIVALHVLVIAFLLFLLYCVIILYALFGITHAKADPIQHKPCKSVAHIANTMHQFGAEALRTYHGQQAQDFLRALNALPPPTNYKADEVAVFLFPPQLTLSRIALFTNACWTVTLPVYIETILETLKTMPKSKEL
jgi:hypothetical protein